LVSARDLQQQQQQQQQQDLGTLISGLIDTGVKVASLGVQTILNSTNGTATPVGQALGNITAAVLNNTTRGANRSITTADDAASRPAINGSQFAQNFTGFLGAVFNNITQAGQQQRQQQQLEQQQQQQQQAVTPKPSTSGSSVASPALALAITGAAVVLSYILGHF
jgi:hypothetical protein